MRKKLKLLRMKTYSQQGGYLQTEVVQKEKSRRKRVQLQQHQQFKILPMQQQLTQFAQSRDPYSKKYQILKTISATAHKTTIKASEM